MRYLPLGSSGLKVSAAGLGTMSFGNAGGPARCDEADAVLIIDEFLDAGGNFIDTADSYSGGQAEAIIGSALGRKRDATVLATKAYLPTGQGPNDRGLSRRHLTQALEASLQRLQTDYVDLYQCHHWDKTTPIDETVATLDGFVRAGKIRYAGCSNFTAAQIVETQWAADRMHAAKFVSLQAQYSLLARTIEAEILSTCEQHGLGVIAWSPLGGGLLARDYTRKSTAPEVGSRIDRMARSVTPLNQDWASSLFTAENLQTVEALRGVARELEATPVAVAIAWARRRPGITSVLVGPRTSAQLAASLAGFELDLPEDAVVRLDKASVNATSAPVTGRQVGGSRIRS